MRKGRGEITHISSLFQTYIKRLKPPQESVIRTFIEVVDEVLGITIKPESVSYAVRSKTLHLKISGMVRTEIKLHEGEVLAHLKARLGDVSAPQHIV